VDRAWRRGVELSGAWRPAGWLRLDANVTLSDNRIKDYTSYVAVVDDEWNYTGDTEAFNWGRTTMLLSPSVTGMMRAGVKPWFRASSSFKTFELNVDGKYVGRQYIDNTSRSSMEIPSWFVMNAGASQSFSIWKGMMTLSAYVGNMLNRKYWAYGWRWEDCLAGASKDEIESGIGVYPQAPVNFMFKVSYSF
jgi:iron complex outermembrane receptor protein